MVRAGACATVGVEEEQVSDSSSGRPFDAQEALRISGRAQALVVLIKALAGSDAAVAKRAADKALSHVEHQSAIEQFDGKTPEVWIEGMYDIEQALREATALLSQAAE